MKSILVRCAHPDDEVLGCSGYIAKQNLLGNKVHVLFLSEGVTSRHSKIKIDDQIKLEINDRKKMAIKASNVLKYEILDFLDYPNLRMQNLDTLDITKKIIYFIKKIKPYTVLTHHPGDLNSDHRVTFEATFTALRPFTHKNMVKNFLTFEVTSSTNWSNEGIGPRFSPNYYLDIKKFLKIKKKAFDCYKFEMRDFPHPRSWQAIMAQHLNRGLEIGLEYAEAYSIIRKIN